MPDRMQVHDVPDFSANGCDGVVDAQVTAMLVSNPRPGKLSEDSRQISGINKHISLKFLSCFRDETSRVIHYLFARVRCPRGVVASDCSA
jgi:hypothetical protein